MPFAVMRQETYLWLTSKLYVKKYNGKCQNVSYVICRTDTICNRKQYFRSIFIVNKVFITIIMIIIIIIIVVVNRQIPGAANSNFSGLPLLSPRQRSCEGI